MEKYNNYSKQFKILLAVYIAALTWVILFKMATSSQDISLMAGVRSVNLIPFGEFAQQNGGINFSEIINNVIAFIPCGIYIGVLCKDMRLYKKILLALMVTVIFEVLQYIFALGRSDITDVIENTLGGALGIGIVGILRKIFADEIKMRKIVMIIMAGITIAAIGFATILVVANS